LALRLDNNAFHTLVELNIALSNWASFTYHLRVRSFTGQSPHERFSREPKSLIPLLITQSSLAAQESSNSR
jgi:hypothetical protein